MNSVREVSNPIDVAVIGAGGAGLLAAIAAARQGARTVLFERMKTPAKKVAISGGGRCNFSNTLDARRFVRLFGDRNANSMGHALRAFSNQDLIEMLQQYGVEGQVEKGYRLYTKSGRGADVVAALHAELKKAGGALVTQTRIRSLQKEGDLFALAGTFGESEEQRFARTVIICTGGLSYPVTGSSGDGYAWAREFGHGVTSLRAALVGLVSSDAWTRGLQGLAWPDAQVSLFAGPQPAGKPLATERAEILFTHFGISGPAILDLSNAYVAHELKQALVTLDFYPDESREKLDLRLLETFRSFPNRTAARALDGTMPARLLEHLETQLGADGQTAVTRFPKTARMKLLDMLKSMRVTITGTRGIEYGEVTAGGVDWEHVDPATMESRLAPGLFFAGEILDLTGRCGGFNLQAAFSTGYLAGTSAARKTLALAAPIPGSDKL